MACIELKVHEKLKPYLLQLRRDFSIIPTEQLLSFESFNSMRLFEVLYTASYAGERSELVFDIEDLKLRLGLDGKYDRFKDFRYVLDKAQAEFKQYTCLSFSYRPEKVGRKYRRVHFAILKNEVFKPRVQLPASLAKRVKRESDTEQLMRELQARDALREIGWAQDAERTIQRYGAQRVVDIVAYARKLAGKAEAAGRPISTWPDSSTTSSSKGSSPRRPHRRTTASGSRGRRRAASPPRSPTASISSAGSGRRPPGRGSAKNSAS